MTEKSSALSMFSYNVSDLEYKDDDRINNEDKLKNRSKEKLVESSRDSQNLASSKMMGHASDSVRTEDSPVTP